MYAWVLNINHANRTSDKGVGELQLANNNEFILLEPFSQRKSFRDFQYDGALIEHSTALCKIKISFHEEQRGTVQLV